MTSSDYFIGFEREPEDLDAFLKTQGCVPTPNNSGDSLKTYESIEGGLVDLFYSPEVIKADKGEVPEWSKSGYNIMSELTISTKEFSVVNKAQGIAEEIVKKYNGVLCDPTYGDEFMRKDDL